MHFFMNEVFAAPASALPSFPTALVSQDFLRKCRADRKAGNYRSEKYPFHLFLPKTLKQCPDWISESSWDQVPNPDFVDKYPLSDVSRRDTAHDRVGRNVAGDHGSGCQ